MRRRPFFIKKILDTHAENAVIFSCCYYCCGSPIEALVTDDRYDVPYWVRTSVEHDGTDYYLVGHRDVCMEGLTVRIRRSS